MKKMLMMGVMLLVSAVFAADQVIDLSKKDAWASPKVLAGPDGTLLVKTNVIITAKQMIPVDDKHIYNFSGQIRKNADAVAGTIYCGFLMYDKDKKNITQVMASGQKKSVTELLEPAIKGTKTITIKANPAWIARSYYYVGFNVKEGKLSRENSSSNIKNVKKDGDKMIVSFGRALTKDYPAGTKVRIQTTGGYFYSNVVAGVNENWKSFGKDLKKNQLWAEVAYIRPMILCNWTLPQGTDKSKVESQYKNMKLTVKEIK
ncbi:MAG: hypothetical protein IKB16_07080 [Lentisphaeria bacterium]|nr:hypothetical protein [Lentisphaeria bacterium]